MKVNGLREVDASINLVNLLNPLGDKKHGERSEQTNR